MNELFEKEGNSIFTFKSGDIIIKLKKRVITKEKENENLGIVTEVVVGYDNSYRRPLEFMGIENNIIYLRDLKEHCFWKKKLVYQAYVDEHSEGWALFVVPKGLAIDDCL